MKPTTRHLDALGRWKPGAAYLVCGLLLLPCLPGCGTEKPISGQELQTLKRETVIQNQGKLTPEEEIQIESIQSGTRSDFERKVERIRQHPQAAGTPQAAQAAPAKEE